MESDTRKWRGRCCVGALALVVLVLASSGWAQDLTVDNGNTLTVTSAITYDNEYIGDSGTGTLNQTSATNTVNDDLYLGYNSTGSGTYNLSGTGSLTAPSQAIGYNGTGTFTQTGGSNTITDQLDLGTNPGSLGTYSLSLADMKDQLIYFYDLG